MAEEPAIPSSLLTWLTNEIGAVAATAFAGWDHAESAVWQVVPERGDPVFVKHHRQPRKFRQELRAYSEWTPHLGSAAPRLLATRIDDPLALVLEAAPGVVALGRTGCEPAVHRTAGAVLRRLHDIPFSDDDALSLADAVGARLVNYLGRGRATGVDEAVLEWVDARVRGALPLLDGIERVPCHRDYTPRNWLTTAAGGFTVIDFEHARPDLWLLDVERLRSTAWLGGDELEGAFWEGYGRAPSDRERELLDRVAPMTALGTVVWAREHGDHEFEAEGWSALTRAGAPVI